MVVKETPNRIAGVEIHMARHKSYNDGECKCLDDALLVNQEEVSISVL